MKFGNEGLIRQVMVGERKSSATGGSRRVTFIYTNSHDATADLLMTKIVADGIFRFNFNLWRDYAILLTTSGFEIENPADLKVTDRHVAKFLWRKPI